MAIDTDKIRGILQEIWEILDKMRVGLAVIEKNKLYVSPDLDIDLPAEVKTNLLSQYANAKAKLVNLVASLP